MEENLNVPASPWESDKENQPLVKESVKATADLLFAQIASGQYSYGTRMEAERELAAECGVSRTTIRQALDFLETYKVVARRPNSGTFVTYQNGAQPQRKYQNPSSHLLDISAIAETASPFEMTVVCSILEPEMARLATLNMSTRDLKKLSAILEEIESIVTDSERFARLEKEFLMAVADGTHCGLFIAIYQIVSEVRRQPHWCATRMQMLTPERISQAQQELRSFYNALESRDIETAVEYMKLLIASTQETMIYSP